MLLAKKSNVPFVVDGVKQRYIYIYSIKNRLDKLSSSPESF